VSVYGNDVSAGGSFASAESGACDGTNNHAKIEAYTRQNGPGSGTQLAALALGEITGFKSAFLRDSGVAPRQPLGLSFGNTAGAYGGNYSQVNCATNYYNDTMLPEGSDNRVDSNASSINLDNVDSGKQTVSSANQVTLTASTSFGKKHTIFVNGDVYIRDNITYSTNPDGSWTNIGSIPYFVLIAKGNIYIDSSVTQLDGLFVAQPDDSGNRGEIYTCATSFAPPSQIGSSLWNTCRTRLIIHGSFVTKKAHFLRTIDTLSDGASAEPAGASRAAEIFEFSPEMYLAEPVLRRSGTSTTGEYDYITTLPPVL
jgi:hypothetical protein